METVTLGKTNLRVSRLCFGSLVIGPLQLNMSDQEGADVICRAFEQGVNFIDTAELYGTYPHIREAIRRTKKEPVIATKSYAYSTQGARESLEKARKQLDVDVIDIFLMHEQESRLTLRGHQEALEFYIEAKVKGLIKAVGVSTHRIEVVEACAHMDHIDVIHPLVNQTGIGIGDGTIEEMLLAVKNAYDQGKGIYSMKALGGGNLLKTFNESMNFVLGLPYIHSVAVGMQSKEEVDMNCRIFHDNKVPKDITMGVQGSVKRLHIDYWCELCGCCVDKCGQNALKIKDGKLIVHHERCVLCGYCASVCPQFAIKVC
jgi:predicted aldo/keto reductase-like oxidoreductase